MFWKKLLPTASYLFIAYLLVPYQHGNSMREESFGSSSHPDSSVPRALSSKYFYSSCSMFVSLINKHDLYSLPISRAVMTSLYLRNMTQTGELPLSSFAIQWSTWWYPRCLGKNGLSAFPCLCTIILYLKIYRLHINRHSVHQSFSNYSLRTVSHILAQKERHKDNSNAGLLLY